MTFTFWLKVVHFSALLVWCAGLFSLPSLFAAYPHVHRPVAMELLRAQTRFGYVAVLSPAAVIAIVSGALLIFTTDARGGWLNLKLTAVSLLVVFHVLCGALVAKLHDSPCTLRSRSLLMLTCIPAALVPLILWLVLAKPL